LAIGPPPKSGLSENLVVDLALPLQFDLRLIDVDFSAEIGRDPIR
jgi:hypothetical protein